MNRMINLGLNIGVLLAEMSGKRDSTVLKSSNPD
jgi:hypothetical protein